MTVPEKLIEYGIAQGFGVFFVLFVLVAWLLWKFVEKVMEKNDEREKRYIDTIDTLAASFSKVDDIMTCVTEARRDIDETKRLVGRVLDRLPAKGE